MRAIPSSLIVVIAGLALLAAGAPAAADPGITGFTTHGPGELRGVVLGDDGKPLGGVAVFIVPASGTQHHVVTDKRGQYRTRLASEQAMVFVRGHVRIGGQLAVEHQGGGGSVVEIRDTVPPKTMPTWRSTYATIPPYSETAKDTNVWAKAWLLLDIDETGVVARVKLLAKPGADLDRIATAEALALRFEPARDGANQPVRAMLLWSFEWPSYFWMLDQKHPFPRVPAAVKRVPCRGSGGTSKYFRDCTEADIGRGLSEPWIDAKKPKA